jgi:CRP-like cAMP-binding protein
MVEQIPVSPTLEQLAARSDAESFEPGEPVFREGEPAHLLFFLSSGSVAIEREGVALREIAAGRFFGVEALFGESVRATTARARTAATVVPVGLPLYSRLAAEDPGFAARVRAARRDEEEARASR